MPKKNDTVSPEDHQRLVENYYEIAALAGGLAHEIKNPLSTIRLTMELLGEDFADSKSPRDRRALSRMELVQSECQRLQDVLDDFLSFARAGRLNLEAGDLNQLVQQVMDFFRPQAEKVSIEMLSYLDPDLPSVMIDNESLYGALLNLVLNAQQAMPGGGQLVFRTRISARGVALDLIDTGCGMDEHTLAHMFDTFYSTKRGGSGLGLPTTRKVVEAHVGTITVQSEVGRGTQFTIELPTLPRITETTGKGNSLEGSNAEGSDMQGSDSKLVQDHAERESEFEQSD